MMVLERWPGFLALLWGVRGITRQAAPGNDCKTKRCLIWGRDEAMRGPIRRPRASRGRPQQWHLGYRRSQDKTGPELLKARVD